VSEFPEAAFIALEDDARTEFFAEVERLIRSWAAFKSSRLTGVKWCQPKPTSRASSPTKTVRVAVLRGSPLRADSAVSATGKPLTLCARFGGPPSLLTRSAHALPFHDATDLERICRSINETFLPPTIDSPAMGA
jgi:hypothetical protein